MASSNTDSNIEINNQINENSEKSKENNTKNEANNGTNKNIEKNFKISMSKTILGKGAFGTVFLGYKFNPDGTSEKIALKEIPKQLNDAESQKALDNEINICEQLDNTNIVKMIKIAKDIGDKNYLVYELCNGGDLRRYMDYFKTFDEELIQIIMIQMVNALFELHRKKVVHHDIKPENILIQLFPEDEKEKEKKRTKEEEEEIEKKIKDIKEATSKNKTPMNNQFAMNNQNQMNNQYAMNNQNQMINQYAINNQNQMINQYAINNQNQMINQYAINNQNQMINQYAINNQNQMINQYAINNQNQMNNQFAINNQNQMINQFAMNNQNQMINQYALNNQNQMNSQTPMNNQCFNNNQTQNNSQIPFNNQTPNNNQNSNNNQLQNKYFTPNQNNNNFVNINMNNQVPCNSNMNCNYQMNLNQTCPPMINNQMNNLNNYNYNQYGNNNYNGNFNQTNNFQNIQNAKNLSAMNYNSCDVYNKNNVNNANSLANMNEKTSINNNHNNINQNNIIEKPMSDNEILKILKKARFKLSDFGLSKLKPTDPNSKEEANRCGSPLYMSPELFLMETSLRTVEDQKVDIWALGVLAFEMFFGRRPFEAASIDQLSRMYKIGEYYLNYKDQKENKYIYKDISKEFVEFLNLCFQQDPKERASSYDLRNTDFYNKDYHELKQLNEKELLDSLKSVQRKDNIGIILKIDQKYFKQTEENETQ